MALVIVSNGDKRFTHPGEISSMASELKSFAKSFGKSAYVLDRRRNTADVLEGPVGIVPPPAAAAG